MSEAEGRLDELAKALATGHTRRGVVKIALGFVGAAIAGAVPGRAGAVHNPGGGSDDCAHFCKQLPPGQRDDCLEICKAEPCLRNPANICPGSNPVVCCPGGPTACCGTGAQTTCCGRDEFCQEGRCFLRTCNEPTICFGSTPFCGRFGDVRCTCVETIEGGFTCAASPCGPPCTTTSQCEALLGPGAVCQKPNTGCCGQACLGPCAPASSALLSIASLRSNIPSD